MCSKDKYNLITDFAWYTSILLQLAVILNSKHGEEVANQLIEIAIRVDTVRPYAVESMLSMLFNEKLILSQARKTVSEVNYRYIIDHQPYYENVIMPLIMTTLFIEQCR